MTYRELKKRFEEHEADKPQTHLTAYIVFTADSFNTMYSKKSRTYVVSSDNKAYQPDKGGYSIFASCLDGTDKFLRLESYMAEEKGGKDGWKVEECCIVQE